MGQHRGGFVVMRMLTEYRDGTGRLQPTIADGWVQVGAIESFKPHRAMIVDERYVDVIQVRTKTADEFLVMGAMGDIGKLLEVAHESN